MLTQRHYHHVFAKHYTPYTGDSKKTTTLTIDIVSTKQEPDAFRLYQWMNKPHVVEFWKQAWTKEKIAHYLSNKLASYHRVYWVYANGQPIGYAEIYPVKKDRINAFCEYKQAYGWHFLIGPKQYIGSGYPFFAAHALLSYVFEKIETPYVYCEPDIHNHRMISFAKKLGHQTCKSITLVEKNAQLMLVKQSDFNGIDHTTKHIYPITTQRNRCAHA